MKHTKVIDITTDTSEGELRYIQETELRRDDQPSSLTTDNIHVANKVFRTRDVELDLAGHARHTQELIRILCESERPFDPLVVVAVGDRFYLVDGHYRFTAYRSLGWRAPVPVRVVDGNLDAAWREGLRVNVRHGRPMTLEEKLEAAWRMTRRGGLSKAVIATETAISSRTVGTMRRRLVELREERQDPEALTWWQAKAGRPKETLDAESYREKVVAEMAKRLLGAFGPGLEGKADFLAEAIGVAYPGLPVALVGHWPEAVETMMEERAASPF